MKKHQALFLFALLWWVSVTYFPADAQYSPPLNVTTISPGSVVSTLKPSSDSTSAIQIFKADGSTIQMSFDTTNSRVGINKSAPSVTLDVNGVIGGTSFTANSNGAAFSSGALSLGVSTNITFQSVSSIFSGAVDTVLNRQAAGVLQINAGTGAGSLGSIRAKHQSSDGTVGVTVTNCTGFKDGVCISGT